MRESTAPDWYDGATPWEGLSRPVRLYEVVTAGRGPSAAEILELTGFLVPEPKVAAVAAVVDFAGRTGEEAEIAAAVDWLTEYGFMLDTGQPAE